MNVLICDDQKDHADSLAALLGESGFDTKITVFSNAQQALDYVSSGAPVDCCFLDIFMPGMDGVELAEKIREGHFNGEIVFLTSSNEFAQESYKVKAFDYIVKPPTPETVRNLLHALEKAIRAGDKKGLMLKTQGALKPVLFRDISSVEVIDPTIHIRLVNGDEITVSTKNTRFSEIAEQLLSDSRFVKCHRSYIINISEIDSISDNMVTMRDGARVPISRGLSQVKDRMVELIFAGTR